MKKISELVTITGGSILENSSTIVEAIITTNGWDKTFIPAVLEMSSELKVSVINTYEFMVHENIPKHTIRRALDGIVIPHIPQK
ncbi:hypothetical protein SDC9_171720 [bioreactor metagenome]|uniref:Uncharacterized protein n=1 Tax=bioreactor metagenome TaxID=1076179 RepID=A0A645GKS8_9ZZZZ